MSKAGVPAFPSLASQQEHKADKSFPFLLCQCFLHLHCPGCRSSQTTRSCSSETSPN